MVITFVLYPLSHYNSIIGPRAQFLLSLLEHLIIDFPSHFILSIIDVHLDSTSLDKLIFPSSIMRILCHFSVPLLMSDHFTYICAIDAATIARGSLGRDRSQQLLPPVRLHLDLLHPYLLSPLPRVMCHWETSWPSFSAWMLAKIHFLQSCIR